MNWLNLMKFNMNEVLNGTNFAKILILFFRNHIKKSFYRFEEEESRFVDIERV